MTPVRGVFDGSCSSVFGIFGGRFYCYGFLDFLVMEDEVSSGNWTSRVGVLGISWYVQKCDFQLALGWICV